VNFAHRSVLRWPGGFSKLRPEAAALRWALAGDPASPLECCVVAGAPVGVLESHAVVAAGVQAVGLERHAVVAAEIQAVVLEPRAVVEAEVRAAVPERRAVVAAGIRDGMLECPVVVAPWLPGGSELSSGLREYSSLYPHDSLWLLYCGCAAARRGRCGPLRGGGRWGGETTNRPGEGARGPTR